MPHRQIVKLTRVVGLLVSMSTSTVQCTTNSINTHLVNITCNNKKESIDNVLTGTTHTIGGHSDRWVDRLLHRRIGFLVEYQEKHAGLYVYV